MLHQINYFVEHAALLSPWHDKLLIKTQFRIRVWIFWQKLSSTCAAVLRDSLIFNFYLSLDFRNWKTVNLISNHFSCVKNLIKYRGIVFRVFRVGCMLLHNLSKPKCKLTNDWRGILNKLQIQHSVQLWKCRTACLAIVFVVYHICH